MTFFIVLLDEDTGSELEMDLGVELEDVDVDVDLDVDEEFDVSKLVNRLIHQTQQKKKKSVNNIDFTVDCDFTLPCLSNLPPSKSWDWRPVLRK